MISNETLDLLKSDFQQLSLSKNKEKKYEEVLNSLSPVLIEARQNGLSFSQISNVLKSRDIKIPIKFVQSFIQEKTGEKRKPKKKHKSILIKESDSI